MVYIRNAVIKEANSPSELMDLFNSGNLERHTGTFDWRLPSAIFNSWDSNLWYFKQVSVLYFPDEYSDLFLSILLLYMHRCDQDECGE